MWLMRPLIDTETINARLDTVEHLLADPECYGNMRTSLQRVRPV